MIISEPYLGCLMVLVLSCVMVLVLRLSQWWPRMKIVVAAGVAVCRT